MYFPASGRTVVDLVLYVRLSWKEPLVEAVLDRRRGMASEWAFMHVCVSRDFWEQGLQIPHGSYQFTAASLPLRPTACFGNICTITLKSLYSQLHSGGKDWRQLQCSWISVCIALGLVYSLLPIGSLLCLILAPLWSSLRKFSFWNPLSCFCGRHGLLNSRRCHFQPECSSPKSITVWLPCNTFPVFKHTMGFFPIIFMFSVILMHLFSFVR